MQAQADRFFALLAGSVPGRAPGAGPRRTGTRGVLLGVSGTSGRDEVVKFRPASLDSGPLWH